MKFGVVVFPGSNCDHDAFHAIGHVLQKPVEFIWHQSEELHDCDAIILPGGFGTLDELFEMLTWNQLKIHNKPIYFLNTAGFYDPLHLHILHMQKEGFLYDPVEERIHLCPTPAEVLDRLV